MGGGIASLAAAAFLIRDGGVPGRNIVILEALDVLGREPGRSGLARDRLRDPRGTHVQFFVRLHV